MNTYRFTLTYDAEGETPEEAWEQLHDDIYGSLDRREYNVPSDDIPEYSVLSETGYACIVCGQAAAVVDGSLRPACSEHDGLQDIFQVIEKTRDVLVSNKSLFQGVLTGTPGKGYRKILYEQIRLIDALLDDIAIL